MEEYRAHEPTATSAAGLHNIAMNPYQLAMANFERDLADGKQTFNRNPGQESVQQEYSTYVMNALPNFDTLGFWRVRVLRHFQNSFLFSISHKSSVDPRAHFPDDISYCNGLPTNTVVCCSV